MWHSLIQDPASIDKKHLLVIIVDLFNAFVDAAADLNTIVTTTQSVRLGHAKDFLMGNVLYVKLTWWVEASPLVLVKNYFRNQPCAKALIDNMHANSARSIFRSTRMEFCATI